MKTLIALLMLSAVLCMSGCWGYKRPAVPKQNRPALAPAPALISHIVFVKLKDETDIANLHRSADFSLATIPSVSVYASGQHLDTGRSTVLNDYDLAIYIGFESQEDLVAYVAHPQHVSFVERWEPKIDSIRVYDMQDLPAPYVGDLGHDVIWRKKFLGIF